MVRRGPLPATSSTTVLSDIDALTASMKYMQSRNDVELTYHDMFMTEEQQKRDGMITELLGEYLRSYQNKTTRSKACRNWILIPCMLIVIGLTGALIFFGALIFSSENMVMTGEIVAFITVCISFVSSIVVILSIITKYFFPENDEQYITQIVETIQKMIWKTSEKMQRIRQVHLGSK